MRGSASQLFYCAEIPVMAIWKIMFNFAISLLLNFLCGNSLACAAQHMPLYNVWRALPMLVPMLTAQHVPTINDQVGYKLIEVSVIYLLLIHNKAIELYVTWHLGHLLQQFRTFSDLLLLCGRSNNSLISQKFNGVNQRKSSISYWYLELNVWKTHKLTKFTIPFDLLQRTWKLNLSFVCFYLLIKRHSFY